MEVKNNLLLITSAASFDKMLIFLIRPLSVFIGTDKITKKKINHNYKFDIRFHVEPDVKLMQTQDSKTILIELDNEGWKFKCDNYDIGIDKGLYFGNKNLYTENQNIFITGISNNRTENINWKIKKI